MRRGNSLEIVFENDEKESEEDETVAFLNSKSLISNNIRDQIIQLRDSEGDKSEGRGQQKQGVRSLATHPHAHRAPEVEQKRK